VPITAKFSDIFIQKFQEQMITTPPPPCSYAEWRTQALDLLEKDRAPATVLWESDYLQGSLFAAEDSADYSRSRSRPAVPIRIPKEFLRIAKDVACHRSPVKWDLLYRMVWRLAKDKEPHLLKRINDEDTRHLLGLAKEVRRDIHKMHAFVRFRVLKDPSARDGERYIAWFEPEHRIAEHTAPFFVKRFTGMDWSIFTPDESIRWDGKELAVGPGGRPSDLPSEDQQEQFWLSYYKSIFNPARVKLKAMQSEMPKKYWKNLPEAALIEDLTHQAANRTTQMISRAGIEPGAPSSNRYLRSLRR